MKTLEQVKSYPGGPNCNLIDGRDKGRLLRFFPADQWSDFGFSLKEGQEPPIPVPFTRETVMQGLTDDLAFALEKARAQRGISASLMGDVIKMWMWVLDDEELANPGDWDDYGLAYLTRVAEKYGLPVS